MMDSGIKLFGKKISFPEKKNTTDLRPLLSTATATAGAESGSGGSGLEEEKLIGKDAQKDLVKEHNSEAKSSDKSAVSPNGGATAETGGDEPKTLKKPDKILPCPRCNSMDTKFCYYNNYNVHQPRHFCKSCQRYWTAGGTMRSMPIGAGRRKNKNPASQVCQFVQETLTASDGVKVLKFGSDSPHVDGLRMGRENGDDCSSGSTVTTSNSATENLHRSFPQVPCVPWSYNPWNSAICPPGYPTVPIYPSPYWNYIHWLPIENQNAQFLGKHPRDSESISPNGSDELKKPKNSVLTPKTLRIDDPEEAAKSSIWATLGIKNENINSGLFKAFQEKGAERKHPSDDDSQVLHANPAAFSRSICFRELA